MKNKFKFTIIFLIILLILILISISFFVLKNSNIKEKIENSPIIPKDSSYNIDNVFSITVKSDYNLKKQDSKEGHKLLLYSKKDDFEFYISEIANILNYPLIRITEADKEVYHNNWEISSNFSEINNFKINDINGYGYTFNISDENQKEFLIISDFIQIGNRVYAIDGQIPLENKTELTERFNNILNSIVLIENK